MGTDSVRSGCWILSILWAFDGTFLVSVKKKKKNIIPSAISIDAANPDVYPRQPLSSRLGDKAFVWLLKPAGGELCRATSG